MACTISRGRRKLRRLQHRVGTAPVNNSMTTLRSVFSLRPANISGLKGGTFTRYSLSRVVSSLVNSSSTALAASILELFLSAGSMAFMTRTRSSVVDLSVRAA